jgi:hypothetical protein
MLHHQQRLNYPTHQKNRTNNSYAIGYGLAVTRLLSLLMQIVREAQHIRKPLLMNRKPAAKVSFMTYSSIPEIHEYNSWSTLRQFQHHIIIPLLSQLTSVQNRAKGKP